MYGQQPYVYAHTLPHAMFALEAFKSISHLLHISIM